MNARPDRPRLPPDPVPEPFLGYDGFATDDVLEWIERADPEPALLDAVLRYERAHRRRKSITENVESKLRRLSLD